MTNQKEDYSGKNGNMFNRSISETERFDRSISNSESDSSNDEFHWMAHASYNFTMAPELSLETTQNETSHSNQMSNTGIINGGFQPNKSAQVQTGKK